MERKPAGFYIQTIFRFEGVKYGVLRNEDYPKFVRYVRITNQNAKYTDWITVSDTVVSVLKHHYLKYFKKQDS